MTPAQEYAEPRVKHQALQKVGKKRAIVISEQDYLRELEDAFNAGIAHEREGKHMEHVNNAKDKAMADVKREFGLRGFATMERLQETGIMAMFHVDPNPITQYYVDQVTAYVNEGRGEP